MASEVQVMEKPVQFQQHQHQQQQQQQQQPQEALKCPRCDSSNTKFCYFNNYSLSQPRHFCKACKRYWTRGGTLRNVPVGGGCRKNKRVKRSITTSTIHVARSNPSSHLQTNPNPNKNLDHNPNNPIPSSTTSNGTSNHHLNPLFYGLFPQNHNYPRFDHTRVVSGYDLLQPQTNGLGFSSTGSFAPTNGHNSNSNSNPNLTFANYNSSLYNYGGSSSTMASLLASSRFTGFATGDAGSMVKDDHKLEETESYRVEWNSNNFHDQNKNDDQTDHDHDHHNSLLWDTEAGTWLDRSVE